MNTLMYLLKKAVSTLPGQQKPTGLPDEIESNIHFLQDPFGDPPHLQRAKQALQFLLEHADDSHPRLLELIKSGYASNPIAVIEALPGFGRPQSIPVLEDVLAQGGETLSGAAALALARHPHDDAREALLRGLSFPRVESIVAAADGLISRGDRTVCDALLKHLDQGNSNARYHLIQAAVHLGCLNPETLAHIANEDPDEDIRALASRTEINYSPNG